MIGWRTGTISLDLLRLISARHTGEDCVWQALAAGQSASTHTGMHTPGCTQRRNQSILRVHTRTQQTHRAFFFFLRPGWWDVVHHTYKRRNRTSTGNLYSSTDWRSTTTNWPHIQKTENRLQPHLLYNRSKTEDGNLSNRSCKLITQAEFHLQDEVLEGKLWKVGLPKVLVLCSVSLANLWLASGDKKSPTDGGACPHHSHVQQDYYFF